MKYIVTLNGKNYEVDVTETEAVVTGVKEVSTAPVAAPVSAPAAAPAAAPALTVPSQGATMVAPVGTAVKAGDVILILEAMKMENDIVAPCDGTVKQVLVAKGASVNTDDVLAVI